MSYFSLSVVLVARHGPMYTFGDTTLVLSLEATSGLGIAGFPFASQLRVVTTDDMGLPNVRSLSPSEPEIAELMSRLADLRFPEELPAVHSRENHTARSWSHIMLAARQELGSRESAATATLHLYTEDRGYAGTDASALRALFQSLLRISALDERRYEYLIDAG